MASVPRSRLRGTMLWFNAAKDVGALRTEAGERIEVPGSAFSLGERPAGRCAGAPVEFQSVGGEVTDILVVPEPDRRRARTRRSR